MCWLKLTIVAIDQIFKCHADVQWLTGYSLSISENNYYFSNNKKVPGVYERSLIQQGVYGKMMPFIYQESTFWKTDLNNLIDFNVFKQFHYAGDFYLWRTFSQKYELYATDLCLSVFRYHDDQISINKCMYFKEFNEIRDHHFSVIAILKACYYYIELQLPGKIKSKLNDDRKRKQKRYGFSYTDLVENNE